MVLLTEKDFEEIYKGTGISKREFKKLLKNTGSSKVNKTMPALTKQKTFIQKLIDKIIC